MTGKTDTNAIIGGTDELTFSDAEISGVLQHEQEVRSVFIISNRKISD